jgi:hypothetical protein
MSSFASSGNQDVAASLIDNLGWRTGINPIGTGKKAIEFCLLFVYPPIKGLGLSSRDNDTGVVHVAASTVFTHLWLSSEFMSVLLFIT